MAMTRGNPNAFAELGLRLKALGNVEGKVGWFEASKYEDGTPVASVAEMQEYGTKSIPARPFMRPAIIKNQQKWADIATAANAKALEGEITPYDAMNAVVNVAEGDVLQSIKDVLSPPLSLITLLLRKYKKEGRTVTGKVVGEAARALHGGPIDLSGVSTKPLIDSGVMFGTLTTNVEEKK